MERNERIYRRILKRHVVGGRVIDDLALQRDLLKKADADDSFAVYYHNLRNPDDIVERDALAERLMKNKKAILKRVNENLGICSGVAFGAGIVSVAFLVAGAIVCFCKWENSTLFERGVAFGGLGGAVAGFFGSLGCILAIDKIPDKIAAKYEKLLHELGYEYNDKEDKWQPREEIETDGAATAADDATADAATASAGAADAEL